MRLVAVPCYYYYFYYYYYCYYYYYYYYYIDLKNAFGEVHHELIRAVLRFHHIPRSIEKFILHLYDGFRISVAANRFLTDPIPV